MKYYIYKAEGKKGEIYIGCTNNYKHRIASHKCHNKTKFHGKFYESIRKNGFHYFTFSILEITDKNNKFEREKFYIKKYDSYFNGLNSSMGGAGPSGKVQTNEHIRNRVDKTLENKGWFEVILKKTGKSFGLSNNKLEYSKITGIDHSWLCKVINGKGGQRKYIVKTYKEKPTW